MPKLFSTRRAMILTIAIVVVVTLIGVLLAIFFPPAFKPYVVTVAVGIAAWVGLEAWLRARGRKRQSDFDARMAAREGIADRRREWSSWTDELKKQGIDRYELPFYLLVGEPQSGKSVLLQNSELHFPFGQNRLSGIGGTRGCDWWFTDEAVVLDLAGRLFTHEGGASDEAEWQAFLELLSEFRPMSPANGVLLVLPCDGLMNDTAQQAMAKAGRMQTALLTLTQRLQVQLPVYIILTKGDRVFGFAETVHRLETEKRHEMFGWSRGADRVEAPFELDEARTAFAGLLERCRLLRAQMLATARVPEALGEVDRLFAFPDEFAALLPNFEVYLRSIFTESALLDRLYFRGFYLTSGLQTGKPIAKVCANLLGSTCEADQRNLEVLFTKQRAYFIRDLVRKRVFAERGVVRPTPARVARARRNAWIGYGFAGTLTVATLVGVISYLPGWSADVHGYDHAKEVTLAALDARDGSTPQSFPDLLAALGTMNEAATREPKLLERALPFEIGAKGPAFRDAFVSVFDRVVPRTLRVAVETSLEAQTLAEPGDDAEWRRELAAAMLLQAPIAWDKRDSIAILASYVGASKSDATAPAAGAKPFDLNAAVAVRLAFSKQAPPDWPPAAHDGRRSPALDQICVRTLGRLLARWSDESRGQLRAFTPTDVEASLPWICSALRVPPPPEFAPGVLARLIDIRLALHRPDAGVPAEWAAAVDRLIATYAGSCTPVQITWWSGRDALDMASSGNDVARLLASLELSRDRLPAELTQRPGSDEWIRSVRDAETERLHEAVVRLRGEHWGQDLAVRSDMKTLPLKRVATMVRDLVGRTEVDGRSLRLRDAKLERSMLDFRRSIGELGPSDKLDPKVARVVQELNLLATVLTPLPDASRITNGEMADALKNYANAIEAADSTDAAPHRALAKEWARRADATRKRRDAAKAEDVVAYVPNAYFDGIDDALNGRLVPELRRWFANDVAEFFLDNQRSTWERLVLVNDTTTLPSSGEIQSAVNSMESWLKRDGKLDQIRDSYGLKGDAPSIRPVGDEVQPDNALPWSVVDFLGRLQEFFKTSDAQVMPIATAAFKCVLHPTGDETGSIWGDARRAARILWFGITNNGSGAIVDFKIVDSSITSKELAVPWSCAIETKPSLALGWNEQTEMPTRTSIANRTPGELLEFPGPFGILKFAWSSGSPDSGEASKVWNVSVALKSVSGAPGAKFRVNFERELPRIPEPLKNYRWSR